MDLRERQEISGELEHADVGSFVHLVLAEYFRKFRNQVMEKDALTVGSLVQTVDALFTKEYGDSLMGPVYLLKKQINSHLKDFLVHYQLPLLEKGITMLDLELKSRHRSAGISSKETSTG